MGAVELDQISWPEVQQELAAGRDTVVIAFGATEQRGPHMPLSTDALIGDHLANGVIGDPTHASAEHGSQYWDEALTVTLAAIEAP